MDLLAVGSEQVQSRAGRVEAFSELDCLFSISYWECKVEILAFRTVTKLYRLCEVCSCL